MNNASAVRRTAADNYTVSLPLVKSVDISLFAVLFTLILLYQLQLVASWITDFRVREILYALLYLRIAFFYRVRTTPNFLLVLVFLAYSLFVGVHTYLLYDSELAVQGFLRFVSVALLAPLAGVLLTNIRQVRLFICIWLGVIVVGAATAVYQFLGGDLTWLAQDYVAVRGGLDRFKTLLGEPNVGGMAAVVTYIFAVLGVRNWIFKSLLLLVVFLLLILSLSKAAVAGCVLATVILLLNFRTALNASTLRRALLVGIAAVVASLFLFVLDTEVKHQYEAYVDAGVAAVYGADVDGKSITEDLSDRLVGRTIEGIENARKMSDLYLLDVFLGSSFGAAGSAAFELSGGDFALGSASLLPHNSFSEIYLVGGVVMLTVFLAILVRTFYKLWIVRNRSGTHMAMLGGFIVVTAFTVGYPVVYEPILGAFFWLTVGYVASYRVASERRNTSESGQSTSL